MKSVDSERVATDATANHGRAWRLIMAVNRTLGCVKLTADELTNFASGPGPRSIRRS